jgi:hypothetical protein
MNDFDAVDDVVADAHALMKAAGQAGLDIVYLEVGPMTFQAMHTSGGPGDILTVNFDSPMGAGRIEAVVRLNPALSERRVQAIVALPE